jgi:methylthioribose-1-phosphate isomerase
MASSSYVTFLDSPKQIEIFDQRKLPLQEIKIRFRTVDDVKKGIENEIVYGPNVSFLAFILRSACWQDKCL